MKEQNLQVLDLWNPNMMVVWNKRPLPGNVVSFSHNNVAIIQTNDSNLNQPEKSETIPATTEITGEKPGNTPASKT